jgi:hypothetical protein
MIKTQKFKSNLDFARSFLKKTVSKGNGTYRDNLGKLQKELDEAMARIALKKDTYVKKQLGNGVCPWTKAYKIVEKQYWVNNCMDLLLSSALDIYHAAYNYEESPAESVSRGRVSCFTDLSTLQKVLPRNTPESIMTFYGKLEYVSKERLEKILDGVIAFYLGR